MKTNKKQRIAVVLISLLIGGFGVSLILFNFNENIIFFYSPSDIESKIISDKKVIRVGGLVKEGTIFRDNKNINFVVTDLNKDLKVQYSGLLPSLFKEGQGTVAKGIFNGKFFEAHEILAKHDENYMPKEVVKAIKKTGQWRE